MADKKPPSLYEIIERVLAQVQGPMPIDELAKRILAIYPSRAKHPLTSVRSILRLEHAGQTLVFLDRQTILPLHVAMQGVRFRIPLTREEVDRGVLCIAPAFDCFRRQGLAHQAMHLLDATGHPLASHVVTLKQQVTGPLGSFTQETPACELGAWYRAHRVRHNDSVLVTIEDWQHGRFRLEHEPANQRRQQDIERQNQELANVLFAMLGGPRMPACPIRVAIQGTTGPKSSPMMPACSGMALVSTTAIFVRRGTRCYCWHSRRIMSLPRSPIRRNRPARSTASLPPCGIGHSSGAVWKSRAARHWPTSMPSCARRFAMTRPIIWEASGGWYGGGRRSAFARSTWGTSIPSGGSGAGQHLGGGWSRGRTGGGLRLRRLDRASWPRRRRSTRATRVGANGRSTSIARRARAKAEE